jgi:hypothetical protein
MIGTKEQKMQLVEFVNLLCVSENIKFALRQCQYFDDVVVKNVCCIDVLYEYE